MAGARKINESYNFYLLPKHKSWGRVKKDSTEYNDNMTFWSYHICDWEQVEEPEVVKGAGLAKEVLLVPMSAVGSTD